MKIVLQQLDALAPDVRDAFLAMIVQVSKAYHVSHTDDDRVKHDVWSSYHNTTQDHTSSGSFVAVNFNADDDLRSIPTLSTLAGVHDTTTRPDRFIVPGEIGGPMRWCRVRAKVTFAANATGDRGLRIMLDDAVVRRPAQMLAPTASNAARLTAVASFPASPGQAIHIEAYQSSGGTLALGGSARTDTNDIDLEFC